MDTMHATRTFAPPLRDAGTSPVVAWLRRVLSAERTPRASRVTYSGPLVAYVTACAGLAALLAVLRASHIDDWSGVAIAAGVVFVLSAISVRAARGVEMVFSTTPLLLIGIVLTFGPIGGVIAASAEAAGVALLARSGWFRMTFNLSNVVIDLVAADAAHTAVTRLPLPTDLRAATAGVVTGLTLWFVNHLILAGVFVALSRRLGQARNVVSVATRLLPYYAAYGFAAAGLPYLHSSLGTVGILTVAFPLFAAQAFLIAFERGTSAHMEERRHYTELVEDQNRSLEQERVRVERAHDATLIALTNALDARDKETEGHSRRVVEYSRAIGTRLGLDGDRMRILSHGALLHDIGKIGVPDSILLKPAKLTEEEWELMRRHPEIGEAMVRNVDVLRDARRIILHHHERWDGTGYPRGLRGSEIEVGARIFAVADAVDAMTQDRPYRSARSMDQARAEVRRCRGLDFDPDAVDAFLALSDAELVAIQKLRTPPGLDLLIDSHARERYLRSIGLGNGAAPLLGAA